MAAVINIGILEAILRVRDEGTSTLVLAGQKMTAAVGQIDKLGKGLSDAGGKLMPISLAVGAAGIGLAKAAIDFESSFAGIRKTVNASEKEFAALATGMRNLSKEIPVNVNELNRIGEAAGQLGIKTENILGFTRVMADLGNATNLSSDEAATSLARLANITQMSQQDFDRLGSSIVGLGNNFATTEAEIVEFGLRIAGAGAQAKMSEADILGIGAALSSVGVEAEAGGTAVQKVILDMVKATVQGGESLDLFAKAAGMSAEQFRAAFQEDAAGAFTAFVEGLGREGQNAINVLSDLGLEDQRLIRSFLALSGAGDLLSRTIKQSNVDWTANNALTEEARRRYETTASKLQILWNQVKDVAITLGDAMLPVLQSLVAAFQEWLPTIERAAQWFTELDPGMQQAIFAFGALVAAGGPAVYMLGNFLQAIGTIKPVLAWMVGSQGLAGAAGALDKTATAARTAGTAFSTASPLVTGFSTALLGIAVPLALDQVLKALKELKGLVDDSKGWQIGAEGENWTHMRMLAEATRVAGREIKNLEEGERILRLEAERLRSANGGLEQGLEQLRNGSIKVVGSVKDLTVTTDGAKPKIAAVTEEVKRAGQAGVQAGADLAVMSDAVKSLVDELSGKGALQTARDYEAAIKSIGGTTRLTADEKDQYVTTLDAVIAKYRVLGPEGQKIVDHYTAVRNQVLDLKGKFDELRKLEMAPADGLQKFIGTQDPKGVPDGLALPPSLTAEYERYYAEVDRVVGRVTDLQHATEQAHASTLAGIGPMKAGYEQVAGAVQHMAIAMNDVTTMSTKKLQQLVEDMKGPGAGGAFGLGFYQTSQIRQLMDELRKRGASSIDLTPRAMGGPVDRGMPYLVGERGPELFVPQGAGTIVPGGAAAAAGSGGTRQPIVTKVVIDGREVAEALTQVLV